MHHGHSAARVTRQVSLVHRVGAAPERALLPLVVATAIVAILVPAQARQAAAHHGVTAALVCLVFTVGLGLPVTDLAQARAHSTRIAVVVVAPVVVLPALAWSASRLVDPGPLSPDPPRQVGGRRLAGGSGLVTWVGVAVFPAGAGVST